MSGNLSTDHSKDSMEDSHLPYSVPCPPEHNKKSLELEEESFHVTTQLENLLTNFAHK